MEEAGGGGRVCFVWVEKFEFLSKVRRGEAHEFGLLICKFAIHSDPRIWSRRPGGNERSMVVLTLHSWLGAQPARLAFDVVQEKLVVPVSCESHRNVR